MRRTRYARDLRRPRAPEYRAQAWRTGQRRTARAGRIGADALPTGAELLVLDQALDRLDALSARQREVVELRYLAGLEFAEIAALLEVSERTAKREWERARAFLYTQLR